MKTVGIIGGHDFLGCDITLKFLSENYRVKILVPKLKHNDFVITTGLKAGENLLFCQINMKNQYQLEDFLKDCDCLIHCGIPYELSVNSGEGSLYIPVVSNTGTLLKSLNSSPKIGKIIFLTSVAVFNLFNTGFSSATLTREKTNSTSKHKLAETAFYHSDKLVDRILNNFSDDQIEVVIVSPVVALNNTLINTEKATLAGLQYMFRNKITHDRIFQRLIRRKQMKTMVNVIELPDLVFDSIRKYYKSQSGQSIVLTSG